MMRSIVQFLESGPIHAVGRAAFIIAAAGIASRLLGLIRDRLLAAQFGAGDVLDAYYAAFRIPDLVYSFLVLGALSAALVPVFTELYVTKKKDEAWALASGVLNLLVLGLGILAGAGALFAPELTNLLTPGFSPEKQAWTAQLMRVMFLSPVILGVSAVFGGILVSFKRFIIYALAPLFYNLGIITSIVLLVPEMGPIGLAWGVVAGAMLHALVQWLDVRRTEYRHQWNLFSLWGDRNVRRVMTLMIPRSLGLAANQVSLLIVTIFASTLMSGSLSVFTFANNIQSVPFGLFGVAFALAVFPVLSTLAAERSEAEFLRTLSLTFRRILFFVVPVSVLIIVLRAQIVRVVLGSGQFNWEDTILTFQVLGILAVSLFAQSLIPLLSRAFFALQNTMTPLFIALVSEGVHILLTLFLLPRYHILGLALAFSLATVLNALLLYVCLRRRFSGWSDGAFFGPAFKIAAVSLGAGIIAQLAKSSFGFSPSPLDTFVEIFFQLIVTGVIGLGAFWMLASWIHIEEFEELKRFLARKVFGQPSTIIEAEETTAGER